MNIITVDFETYYSKDIGFSKMTTEEYVRCPEFHCIGVAVQVNDGKPEWFSGSHADMHQFLSKYDWANSAALAHNAIFDGAILSWIFGIRPKRWLDTLSMGRAIHGTEVGGSLGTLAGYYGLGTKGTEVVNAMGLRLEDFPPDQLEAYGKYCENDVALTWSLFNTMAPTFPLVELKLIDVTIKMFTEPVLYLDKAILEEHLNAVRATKDALLVTIEHSKEDLMSNPKLADLLRTMGVEPPTKVSPTTGKTTYAFAKSDEDFKALLEHENPAVQAIVAARLGVKSTLEETRTERFIGIAERGSLPVPLRYYAAHTGRWGGDDKLNLQNLPRKSALKKAIIAPTGYSVIDSDSSQIEARTLAWLAGQNDLVAAFDRGEDVYCIMASAIYGRPITKKDERERFVGKTTILGAGYGMGAAKFQAQLKNFGVEVDLEEAQRIINTYRETYPKIPELWRTAQAVLGAIIGGQSTEFGRDGVLKVHGTDGILLPNGLYLKYQNLRMVEHEVNGKWKAEFVYDTRKWKVTVPNRIYGGKVIENVCQALARIVIGDQLLMVAKKYKVAMTVHDAICAVVPAQEVERAQEYVELCMKLRPQWAPDLPLNCESGYGASYGDC